MPLDRQGPQRLVQIQSAREKQKAFYSFTRHINQGLLGIRGELPDKIKNNFLNFGTLFNIFNMVAPLTTGVIWKHLVKPNQNEAEFGIPIMCDSLINAVVLGSLYAESIVRDMSVVNNVILMFGMYNLGINAGRIGLNEIKYITQSAFFPHQKQ